MVVFQIVSAAESAASPVLRECPTCNESFTGESFCPNDGTRLSRTSEIIPPPDPLVGTVFADRYRIIRRIGEGGMGVVYEAEHVVIEKRVAVKLLRDTYAGRQDVLERFKQEAKSASRIGHENIVDITDFGETPSHGVFFVMEFLEGCDLADVLRETRIVPVDRGVAITTQVCRGLSAAHSKGIIHRDMKPENIFLAARDGQKDFVKILDFGIAKMSELGDTNPGRKLTKTGMIFGTPEYMSPEQAAGKPLDHRVDVYSVGIILYEMFAGRVPFTGESFMGILTKHMFEPPPTMRSLNPQLSIPASLEGVIMKCIAKDPTHRYAGMGELLEDVQRAMKDPHAIPTPPPMPRMSAMDLGQELTAHTLEGDPYPAPVRRPRSRLPLALAAAVVIVVGGGLGVWISQRSGAAARERDPRVTVSTPPGTTGGASTTGTPTPTGTTGGGAVPTTPPTPPAPATISLQIETVPAGAEILVGDVVVCAATPCALDGMQGSERAIVLRKAGRRTETRVVRFDQARTESVTLRAGGGRPGPGPGPGPGEHPDGPRPGGPSKSDLKAPQGWSDLLR
jgi:serine/threonine-protein kinase